MYEIVCHKLYLEFENHVASNVQHFDDHFSSRLHVSPTPLALLLDQLTLKALHFHLVLSFSL